MLENEGLKPPGGEGPGAPGPGPPPPPGILSGACGVGGSEGIVENPLGRILRDLETNLLKGERLRVELGPSGPAALLLKLGL